MKQIPSLKQFEYLVALAEDEHFGKAAQRCNVTPSTLSVGIRDLEKTLNIVLAERSKRNVIMTSIGRDIAALASSLLRDAEHIVELAASNKDIMSGDLQLGVIPTISPFLLPKILPSLNEKYPALRLYLHEEQSDVLLEQLRAGQIDTAVMALPYALNRFESMTLFEDPFVFACSGDHDLAGEPEVSAAQLTGAQLMLLKEGHCLRDHALDACQLPISQQREQFEASSLHTLVQMVESGMGVTLLPQLAVDAQITQGTKIKLVPLSFPASREIGLVWRKSSLRSEEFAQLGQALAKPLAH